MPVLTLNQVRLVLGIARAYDQEIDRARAGELLGVVGAGFGFRTVAREALGCYSGRRLGDQGGGSRTRERRRWARPATRFFAASVRSGS